MVHLADVAEQLDVPLVVVVGADDTLAVTSEIVKSALGGQLSISLNLNMFGVGTGPSTSNAVEVARDRRTAWMECSAVCGAVTPGGHR
jgi:hypothetical protein